MAGKRESEGDKQFPVEELKKKYDTTDVVFSGVSVRNGWKTGRMVTEDVYVKAVADFLKAPLGRR